MQLPACGTHICVPYRDVPNTRCRGGIYAARLVAGCGMQLLSNGTSSGRALQREVPSTTAHTNTRRNRIKICMFPKANRHKRIFYYGFQQHGFSFCVSSGGLRFLFSDAQAAARRPERRSAGFQPCLLFLRRGRQDLGPAALHFSQLCSGPAHCPGPMEKGAAVPGRGGQSLHSGRLQVSGLPDRNLQQPPGDRLEGF